MAFTLTDITTKVQQRVRDTNYSTGEITNYLNDTLNDIYNEYRLPFMQTTEDYTTVADVADLTNGSGLPTDYSQAIQLVENSPGTRFIPYIDFTLLNETFDVANGSGKVEYWYKFGETINLYPTPDAAYSLTLSYYKTPTTLSSGSDVPEFPAEFEELLVIGAAYRVLQVKDNYDQAAVLQNRYDELLQKLVVKYNVPQVGSPLRQRMNRYGLGKAHF